MSRARKQRASPREAAAGPAAAGGRTLAGQRKKPEHLGRRQGRPGDAIDIHQQRVTRIKLRRRHSTEVSQETTTATTDEASGSSSSSNNNNNNNNNSSSNNSSSNNSSSNSSNSNMQEESMTPTPPPDHCRQAEATATATAPPATASSPVPAAADQQKQTTPGRLPRIIRIYDRKGLRTIRENGACGGGGGGGGGGGAVLYDRARDDVGERLLRFYYGGDLIGLVDLETLAAVYEKEPVVPGAGGGRGGQGEHAFADVYHGAARVAFHDLVTGRFMAVVRTRGGGDGRRPVIKIKTW